MAQNECILVLTDDRSPEGLQEAMRMEDDMRQAGLIPVGRDISDAALIQETVLLPGLKEIGSLARDPLQKKVRRLVEDFQIRRVVVSNPDTLGCLREVLPRVISREELYRELAAPTSSAATADASVSDCRLLIISNDRSTPCAKAAQFLAGAARASGVFTCVRDGADARLFQFLLRGVSNREPMEQGLVAIRARYDRLIGELGINAVLSLDMDWCFPAFPFGDDARIRRIFSLWYDDFLSWRYRSDNAFFPGEVSAWRPLLQHPRLTHLFYGSHLIEEADYMGLTNRRFLFVAAPREYAGTDEPCEVENRAAFIGNPGIIGDAHPDIVRKLRDGADLQTLRELSRTDLLQNVPVAFAGLEKREPSLRRLMELAMTMRVANPAIGGASALKRASKGMPRAWDFLVESGTLFDAAYRVKLVNRFDRPALIHRIFQRGILDVYSHENDWAEYGVQSRPHVFFGELPGMYRRYACHLNAANSARDAVANEKLFEIAACGRVSVNLDSPDLRLCYGDDEVAMTGHTLEAYEAAVMDLLQHPDRALSMGERARDRTRREHLWEHRMQMALGMRNS